MSDTGNQPTNKADMIANFSNAPSSIQGEPTLMDFLVLIQHLMDCSQSHEYSPSDLSLLFVSLPQQHYAYHMNTAYRIAIANPGNLLNYLLEIPVIASKICLVV